MLTFTVGHACSLIHRALKDFILIIFLPRNYKADWVQTVVNWSLNGSVGDWFFNVYSEVRNDQVPPHDINYIVFGSNYLIITTPRRCQIMILHDSMQRWLNQRGLPPRDIYTGLSKRRDLRTSPQKMPYCILLSIYATFLTIMILHLRLDGRNNTHQTTLSFYNTSI